MEATGLSVRIKTKHGETIVDAADADRVRDYCWVTSKAKCGRLYVSSAKVGRLSRWLLGAPAGLHVDHINGDTLDNRRCNLRICTHQQNQWNRKRAPGKSRFKGVTHVKNNAKHCRWMARIEKDGKRRFLGCFATQLQAAFAYDAAAVELFGEYAAPNFPERAIRGQA